MLVLFTLCLFQATRWFGIERSIFYILTCILLALLIGLIGKYSITKQSTLAFLLIATFSLPAIINFALIPTVSLSQALLPFVGFLKVFLLLLLLSSLPLTTSINFIHRFMLFATSYGFLQWIISSLGFAQRASLIDSHYEIVGFFPIWRVNSLWGESQHFSQVLVFYLLFCFVESSLLNPTENISRKFGIYLSLFMLATSGSTTGYFLSLFVITSHLILSLTKPFLSNLPLSYSSLHSPLTSLKKIFHFILRKQYFFLLLTVFFAFTVFVSTSDALLRQFAKQSSRASLVASFILDTNNLSTGSSGWDSGTRAQSLIRAKDYLSNPSKLPQYSPELATKSKDGFLLNFVRFGFIGSFMVTISLLIVCYIYNFDPLMSLGFLALVLIFWFRGETINATSFQFGLVLSLFMLSFKYGNSRVPARN
ncbi:Uncharacterized conserved membrane protein [Synechococcus sp. RCC307]|nr:Uncharacterized conserved membrane protein [Synechococcus sp. RCC307]